MSLRAELQQEMVRLADGESEPNDLWMWLGGVVQALHDDPDRKADEVSMQAWILLSEYWEHLRSLDDLRRGMGLFAAELSKVKAPVPD